MRILAIATALTALVAAQADNGDAIRDRLDKYLFDYEPQLSSVVADERMTQRDGASRYANSQTAEPTRNREIISEVAFIGLPGGAGWLGFRRVVNVNGKTLADAGPSLAVLLTDGASDDYDQARLLLTESARHNLGWRADDQPSQPATGVPAPPQPASPASSPRRHGEDPRRQHRAHGVRRAFNANDHSTA